VNAGSSFVAPFLIGLDVGTTRVKAVAFDVTGAVAAEADRPTPWCTDSRGIEMDAAVLTDVVRSVAGEAAAALPDVDGPPRVAGLGVTGMGEAGVLTGPDGVPLAPIWAWHDQRADVEHVRTELGEQAFHRAVGMRLDAQPTLPKILRLRTQYPASAAATRFSSVPEWAVASLGGAPGSELSLASRTGLLDVATGGPWAGAVALLGADLLGTPQPAGTPQGVVGVPGLPAALQGAVLVVGGHDHQCAALAAGAARDGTLFNSLGTAEALLRFTAGPLAPAVIGALAQDHDGTALTVGLTVVAGHYCVMAGLRTGSGLERIAGALGATTREQRARLADAAVRIAAAAATDPDQLAGVEVEQLPDGVRLTLTRDAGPARIWCATVQRLVAASGPSIDRITAAVGVHDRVLAAGGWLHDSCVLAAKTAQLPGLAVTSVAEAGAAGAAWLAGVAAGVLPEFAPPVAPWVRTGASSTVPFREVL
jgi:sugar (pentulose or hexulose) kinase